jgi:hypothetical protein
LEARGTISIWITGKKLFKKLSKSLRNNCGIRSVQKRSDLYIELVVPCETVFREPGSPTEKEDEED